ncbi:MAG TPA: hypothetical protein VF234_05905 [Limnochordia bacterium]
MGDDEARSASARAADSLHDESLRLACPPKESSLLEDDVDPAAPFGERYVADVRAVDLDLRALGSPRRSSRATSLHVPDPLSPAMLIRSPRRTPKEAAELPPLSLGRAVWIAAALRRWIGPAPDGEPFID